MIAFRDILIFAGLVALAAAVIASLFPVREGASPVPACSDCAFKLTGGYWIRQHDNYAALYLGTREAARYGWAYVNGRPLRIGENVTCDPMYVHVLNGVAHVSCGDPPPKFGRDVLGTRPLPIFMRFDSDYLRCSFTIEFWGDLAEYETVNVYVYDEEGRLVTSARGTVPGSASFSLPKAGVFRVHIYAPPSLDEWRTAVARVRVEYLFNAEVFTSNNTERRLYALKIFNLTDFWKKGYRSVTVHVNPAGRSFTLSAPTGDFFADFLLAWEDCRRCGQGDDALYVDEVWRVTINQTAGIYTHIHSQRSGNYRHKVYADRIIWDWPWGPWRYERYVYYHYSIPVTICSEEDRAGAKDCGVEYSRVHFIRECRWG